MARKEFIEFMGLKLDLSKTKHKVQYERKFGSPMKEVFKLMSMADVFEAVEAGNTEEIDYEKREKLDKALDKIRSKHGKSSVSTGDIMTNDFGVRR